MIILVTGTAGFIGHYVACHLLAKGHTVVGIDAINDYYDVQLKYARLALDGIAMPQAALFGVAVQSTVFPHYTFIRMALEDDAAMAQLFERYAFDKVCNLAAQAGVRFSLEQPQSYVGSNLHGFVNVLEGCRKTGVQHLVYASSSSVYGLNQKVPFSEKDLTESPASLYAVSKKANELMAFTYHHLYGLPVTGLRFFSVYGPWGRPDMAAILFSQAIMQGRPIKVFNHGNLYRDFTYIDDICDGVTTILEHEPRGDLYNIGCCHPVLLLDFIAMLEEALGKTVHKEYMDMQPGDVYHTYADCTRLQQDYGYAPSTQLREGLTAFVAWFKAFYLP